jgi:hypothetical protein
MHVAAGENQIGGDVVAENPSAAFEFHWKSLGSVIFPVRAEAAQTAGLAK